MVLITESGKETLKIGAMAPAFSDLKGVDSNSYSLASFEQFDVLVLSFTCNHCPYAQAYENRFIELAKTYLPKSVGFIAINANDAETYPDDSFKHMVLRAKEKNYPFPYLHDAAQETAKAYGAVCTPHLFVLDKERRLVYEGRIDDNWKEPDKAKHHDLKDAIDDLLAGRPVAVTNTNPMGCSIKWKT